MLGERFSTLVSFEQLKLAAGLLLLTPNIPMLFMGEEYGETAPFQYFISHTDPDLVEAVRAGRRQEFAAFAWQNEAPDPQAEATFLACKLDHSRRAQGQHRVLLALYRELIRLRHDLPALSQLRRDRLEIQPFETSKSLYMLRWSNTDEVALVFNFHDTPVKLTVPLSPGRWSTILDSADDRWNGNGGSMSTTVASEGEVTLDVQPSAFLILGKDEA
jgi:maltooligosyltrehalose trehalohydrolase